jgi:hypothetical protein
MNLKRWTAQSERDYFTLTTWANNCSWPMKMNHLLLRNSHFPVTGALGRALVTFMCTFQRVSHSVLRIWFCSLISSSWFINASDLYPSSPRVLVLTRLFRFPRPGPPIKIRWQLEFKNNNLRVNGMNSRLFWDIVLTLSGVSTRWRDRMMNWKQPNRQHVY